MNPLLQRVYAAPDDDDARRVYADALLERGDPRGELISIQCRLDAMPDDEHGVAELALAERARELLDLHGDVWTQGWPFELKPVFRRGFPDEQHATSLELAAKLTQAMKLDPTLRAVTFVDQDPRRWAPAAVLASARLDRVTLPVTFRPADAALLRNIRSLTFNGGTLDPAGCAQLAQSAARELAFEFALTGVDFAALGELPLTTLINRGNPMPNVPMQWPGLRRLTLDRVEWRVDARAWKQLERLELFDTKLGRRGVHALLAEGHPKVKRLGLRGERLDSDALAQLEFWPSLEVLDVSGVSRDVLDRSPFVKRLRRLIVR